MSQLDALKIRIFADGANLEEMVTLAQKNFISGLTTNPTLLRKAGVLDYEIFARSVLEKITTLPISFEVFSDDLDEMISQGEKIAAWGENVYVKIPITNTKGVSTSRVVSSLANQGIKVNVTALMTSLQVEQIAESLNPNIPSYVSVFAGRVADTGVDPIPLMKQSINILKPNNNAELIWASPRELLNIFQANDIGCHVITATSDILNKLELVHRDLDNYSLETVKMFYEDAKKSGLTI
jgi:transaldolase